MVRLSAVLEDSIKHALDLAFQAEKVLLGRRDVPVVQRRENASTVGKEEGIADVKEDETEMVWHTAILAEGFFPRGHAQFVTSFVCCSHIVTAPRKTGSITILDSGWRRHSPVSA